MARKIIPSPPPSIKTPQGQYIKNPAAAFDPFILENILFDKQLKFVLDPHDFKIAVCSRRSGKTIACAADLINTCLKNEGIICLYITLAKANARKLVWPELKRLNRIHHLGAEVDETEISLTFPNASIIYCSGAKDKTEIEKFRGLPIKKCYIDECQSFREHIRDLIDDIIAPALMDYAGQLCLIGTPGPLPIGYFAEIAGVVQGNLAQSASWSQHGWTFYDNPWIATKSKRTHDQLLQRELKRRGVTVDDPSIQREWFGKWVIDSDALWIHWSMEKNNYTELPIGPKWNYVMGIDLGFNDADAIAVLAWSETDPNTYLVDEMVMPKQGISELVEQVKYFETKYDVSKMVIDEGGLGKKIAEEMRRRYLIPVQQADKARKQENVGFLNDALRTSRFKAKHSSHFVKDSFLVEIDRSKSTPDRIRLNTSYHSDIIDSVLYAFKESSAFTFEAPKKKLVPGSPEWLEAQPNEMWSQAREHFEEQAELMRNANNMGYPNEE